METHSATIRFRVFRRASLDFSRDLSQDRSHRDLQKGGAVQDCGSRDSVNIFGLIAI